MVLAFPSNDFRQEPWSNERIREFVQAKHPVAWQRFVIFDKTHVNGPQQHPVIAALKRRVPGEIPHNFFKYLVDRKGLAVQRFHKKQDPLLMESDIHALIAEH